MKHRHPRGNGAFSWGCIPGDGRVTYRLFRRSLSGRVFMEARTFHFEAAPRAAIARTVWRMRINLRDVVDAVDLALLGVTEEAA